MEPELPYSIFFDAHALQEADEREHIREHEEQQNEIRRYLETTLGGISDYETDASLISLNNGSMHNRNRSVQEQQQQTAVASASPLLSMRSSTSCSSINQASSTHLLNRDRSIQEQQQAAMASASPLLHMGFSSSSSPINQASPVHHKQPSCTVSQLSFNSPTCLDSTRIDSSQSQSSSSQSPGRFCVFPSTSYSDHSGVSILSSLHSGSPSPRLLHRPPSGLSHSQLSPRFNKYRSQDLSPKRSDGNISELTYTVANTPQHAGQSQCSQSSSKTHATAHSNVLNTHCQRTPGLPRINDKPTSSQIPVPKTSPPGKDRILGDTESNESNRGVVDNRYKLRQLEKVCDSQSSVIIDLNKDIDHLTEQHNRDLTKIQDAEKSILELNNINESKSARIDELNNKLRISSEQNQTEVRTLKQSYASTINELQKRCENQAIRVGELTQQLEGIRKQSSEDIRVLQAKLVMVQDEKARLQKLVDHTKDQLEEAHKLQGSLRYSMKELEETVKEIKENKKQVEDELLKQKDDAVKAVNLSWELKLTEEKEQWEVQVAESRAAWLEEHNNEVQCAIKEAIEKTENECREKWEQEVENAVAERINSESETRENQMETLLEERLTERLHEAKKEWDEAQQAMFSEKEHALETTHRIERKSLQDNLQTLEAVLLQSQTKARKLKERCMKELELRKKKLEDIEAQNKALVDNFRKQMEISKQLTQQIEQQKREFEDRLTDQKHKNDIELEDLKIQSREEVDQQETRFQEKMAQLESKYEEKLKEQECLILSTDQHLEAQVAKVHEQLVSAHRIQLSEVQAKLASTELELQAAKKAENVAITKAKIETESLKVATITVSEAQTLNDQLKQCKREMHALRSELESVNRIVMSQENTIKNYSIQVDGCKREIDTRHNEIQKLIKQLRRYKHKLQEVSKQKEELYSKFKDFETRAKRIVESYKQRHSEQKNKINKIQEKIKSTETDDERQLLYILEALERENMSVLDKMKTNTVELIQDMSHKGEFGQDNKNTESSATQTDDYLTVSKEIHKNYIKAMHHIKCDVSQYIQDSSIRATHTFKEELRRDRVRIAARLRKQYMDCWADLLELDFAGKSKDEKMTIVTEFMDGRINEGHNESTPRTPGVNQDTNITGDREDVPDWWKPDIRKSKLAAMADALSNVAILTNDKNEQTRECSPEKKSVEQEVGDISLEFVTIRTTPEPSHTPDLKHRPAPEGSAQASKSSRFAAMMPRRHRTRTAPAVRLDLPSTLSPAFCSNVNGTPSPGYNVRV